MQIIYFGTPEFAAQILSYILDAKIEVVAVVTQPDRAKGRSLQEAPSPVKQCILDRGAEIPVLQPGKASDPVFLEKLKEIRADLYVVVAYGQILPKALLDIPLKGCINVHASLLPKYRGAAPIQRSLLNGEEETGVSIQKIVKQLDAGDVIATAKIEIPPNMTYGELEQELCELSKPLLIFVLKEYEKGVPHAEPQNHTASTYAAKMTVEEGEILWKRRAEEIHNQVRAYSPRPGAWCWMQIGKEKKRIKILRAEVVRQAGETGKFLSHDGVVGCGSSNSLKIIELQPEGKRVMRAVDFLRGLRELPRF